MKHKCTGGQSEYPEVPHQEDKYWPQKIAKSIRFCQTGIEHFHWRPAYVMYCLSLIVMASTLFACMAGGTAGTGLSYGSLSTQGGDTGVLYANISGVVVDARGKAAPGIIVVADTSKNTEEVATDYVGNFSMLIVAKKGEQVKFQFSDSKGRKWKGSYDSQRLQDGDELSIQLRKDGRASVSLF